MAQPVVMSYTAWNPQSQQRVDGDAANHTLALIRDDQDAIPPTNQPVGKGYGEYVLRLTESESEFTTAVLTGESSTLGVVLVPRAIGRAVRVDQSGTVAVDHNTGGTDALRYMFGGSPIGGGIVRAYKTAEYDAGRYTPEQATTTGSDGRWTAPMYLVPSVEYVITFMKPNAYSVTEVRIIVPAS